MTVLPLPHPQPKQAQFLSSPERYVCYGGARGGGKTFAVRWKAKAYVLAYQGITILILRRELPDLQKSYIEPLCAELVKPCYKGVYKEKTKTLHVGKSKIIFGYCDNDNHLRRYQGNEYDVIMIDEATQFLWDWFDKLKACVRGANDFPKHIFLTCNPGDVGHAWVKRLFIDRDFLPDEDPADYKFIAATVYDNPALIEKDREYVKNLESLTPQLRDAWLYGKWDSFVGQYFTEWRYDIHVCTPFDVPAEWRRYFAMDYGLDMLAGYLIAVSPQGRAYVIKELYESGVIVSDAAKKIKVFCEGEDVFQFLAPPDMWNSQRETGRSIAEIFAQSGVYLTKASNDRVSGWLDVKEYLRIHVSSDGERSAGLQIFSQCINLIRCIPLLQFDKHRINDVSTEPHEITHAPDAIRYFCAGRPHAAPKKEERKNALPPELRDAPKYTGGYMEW